MKACLKLPLGLFAGAAIFTGTIMPVWADTDYRCLNVCVSSGKAESVCMPECTYGHGSQEGGTPDGTLKPVALLPLNHRVLAPLQPLAENTLMPDKKTASSYGETKNYQCIARCLQNKMQYEICERDCTIVTMKNGGTVPSIGNIASVDKH